MIKVLCVDDNDFVAEAIERKLRREPGFEWAGWLPDTINLTERARTSGADVVLLDVDIPGRDSFEALAELTAAEPTIRVIMLSGHVRTDYIDRAVEAGAWGYLSKGEENEVILGAIRRVAAGGFALGNEAESVYHRR
jgi:two-component system invasion response regulator UvrY